MEVVLELFGCVDAVEESINSVSKRVVWIGICDWCCWSYALVFFYLFFFFNDTVTTEIYTRSLHDALPISDSTSVG